MKRLRTIRLGAYFKASSVLTILRASIFERLIVSTTAGVSAANAERAALTVTACKVFALVNGIAESLVIKKSGAVCSPQAV
ncbi:hypothetical protein P3T23_004003 [Paraburkholderia sp. GAS448]